MADRRFHAYAGALALSRVAEIVEAALPSGADGARIFDDVASLSAAGSAEISFLENRKYLGALAATKAGACLVHPSLAARVPAGCHVLAVANPYLAYARLAAAFHPPQRGPAGVHPTAFVDPSAILGEGIAIGPHAVVMAGAKLGAGVEIGPGASVGANVELGDFAVVGAMRSWGRARGSIRACASDKTVSASRRGPAVSSKCRSSVSCASARTARSAPTAASIAAVPATR
jgi:UDP-3-O-[3-hydroxymyristoyl] glucosamine N-acyltransferase